MVFLRVSWAILWRATFVMLINSGIAAVLSMFFLKYHLNIEELVKIRISLRLVPAAILFGVFAHKKLELNSISLHRRPPVSPDQWREIYAVLSALCAGLTAISLVSAFTLNVDTWLAMVKFSYPVLWLLTLIALAVWQTAKTKKRLALRQPTGAGLAAALEQERS